MENMFDSDPVILQKISEQLCVYSNFGVCLDYAHAHLSDTPIEEWIKALRQYIRHIHINDNDLRRDLHLAVGDGGSTGNCFADIIKHILKNAVY